MMTLIKKSLTASLIMCFLMVAALPVLGVTDEVRVPPVDVATKNISSARVITCAIVFPLDQVKFSEQQVSECMKSVNIDAVSYVHVIATSSSTGSSTHNLYLSNRRAGAIEAYLTNRYPSIKVHAFGGGMNPKFGKMARIFIVENLGKPEDIQAGVQVASAGPPEVIERTTTKYITKTEYRDRPKSGIDVSVESGPARTEFSGDAYNYLGVNAQVTRNLPFLDDIKLGASHRMLQSNDAVDINATSLSAARSWNIMQVMGQEMFYEHALSFGVLRANGRAWEWGTNGTAGLQNRDYRMSLHVAKTKYTATIGMGIGVRM